MNKKEGENMKGRIFLSLGMIFVLVTVLTGPALAQQKTFKIGAALAFSGPLAFVGVGFRNGAQIAADFFNEKGGLNIGGEKYKIEIIDADSKSTAEGGETAARRLVDAEKVNLVLGGIAGPDTLGVLSVTGPAKVINVHTAAISEALKGKPYSYRCWISYYEMYPGIFAWLVKNRPKIKRIALLDNDDESAHYGHSLVAKQAAKNGMEVVYDDYYAANTKDMSPFLLKALAKKPDLFFNTASSGAYWALLIKQARDLGYEGAFAEVHPPTPKQTGEIAGMDNVQGMIGFGYASEGDLAPAGIKMFRERYIKKYGEWHEHSLVMGIAMASVFMAVEKAGSTESDKIKAVLDNGQKWETPFGITGSWGGKATYGRPCQWFAPEFVLEIQGEKVVPIGVIPMESMLHGWD
jgi:branched-chain amino acid transport system substrate-binding protein